MFYDYCNFNYKELPYLDHGIDINKDVEEELRIVINNNKSTNNFYFIEKMFPGHITNSNFDSKGKEGVRLDYLKHLNEAN